MKEKEPISYTKSKKLICVWTDKKSYLFQQRMLIFCFILLTPPIEERSKMFVIE